MTTAPVLRDFSATSRLGLALAVTSATGYGLMITATRLTYDAGSNPVTVICARALVPALLLAAVMLARRTSFALAPGAFWPVAGIALGQLGITIGYLSAVAFIPVSLAALVFYAYPVLVAALLAATGHSRVGWAAALAFAAAFFGLAMALAPSFSILDLRGLGLALCATLSGTLLMLAADRLPAAQRMLPLGFYMNLLTLAVVGPYALASGGLTAPVSATGWGALSFVCLGFLIAFFATVGAVRYAGPLRTSLVMNLEPVVAIVGAIVVLGEALGAVQLVGVGLIFAALTLSTLAERPSPPLPPVA
jgi:drug/metabolite transporter (DMT)-like permease